MISLDYNDSIERIVNPLIEPVTLSDVKTYTRISGTTEEAIIVKWITSARIKAENYQRCSYITQQWRLTLNTFPPYYEPIYLPRGPLQSLVEIKCLDIYGVQTSIDITDFIIDTDARTIVLKHEEYWPDIYLKSMKITYKTGYGDAATSVPSYIADAIYVYVAYRNDNRLGETDVVPRVFYEILDEERRFRGI